MQHERNAGTECKKIADHKLDRRNSLESATSKNDLRWFLDHCHVLLSIPDR